jgi:hypothetical protein
MPSLIGNFFIKTLVNSPLHALLGSQFAVITLSGRKTGREFSTPINLMDIDGTLTVISSADRSWWRNLQDGRTARLRHNGRSTAVRGELVTRSDEVIAGLEDCFRVYPGFAKYFGVGADPSGLPAAAANRVLIRLFPV